MNVADAVKLFFTMDMLLLSVCFIYTGGCVLQRCTYTKVIIRIV